jgi:hypothetical protein
MICHVYCFWPIENKQNRALCNKRNNSHKKQCKNTTNGKYYKNKTNRNNAKIQLKEQHKNTNHRQQYKKYQLHWTMQEYN